jgi:hypothetical protein
MTMRMRMPPIEPIVSQREIAPGHTFQGRTVKRWAVVNTVPVYDGNVPVYLSVVRFTDGTKAYVKVRVRGARKQNPLSTPTETMKENPIGFIETILVLVGGATVALLGYGWWKSSQSPTVNNLSVTVAPGPMTVSAAGALNVYAVLPTNATWVTASNYPSLLAGSATPVLISGPYPAAPVSLVWKDATGTQQITTLSVNQ